MFKITSMFFVFIEYLIDCIIIVNNMAMRTEMFITQSIIYKIYNLCKKKCAICIITFFHT